MIGLSLPHLHYAHDSASLATACSPSTCSRSTTAVVANSSRTRLRGPSTSSSSPLLPPSLLFLFTRPDRPLPNGYASGRNFLLMASSSLSGLALPIKLSSSISRGNVVRRRRVRAMFLAVSTHQEGRDVNHLSIRSIVALANQDAGVVNGLLQATASLWSASVVR